MWALSARSGLFHVSIVVANPVTRRRRLRKNRPVLREFSGAKSVPRHYILAATHRCAQRTLRNDRVLCSFAVEFRLCAAVLMCLILQKPFRVDRRHAAGAGRRDCLPIDMILHIAASKDAGNIRFSAVVGFDVAVRI